MGIIKRQAYFGTIINYVGVGIGYLTTGLLFPKFLSPAEIGLLAVLLSYAFIFGQFATLGTGRITIAVFPFFRNREKNHEGFFPLMILVAGTGLAIALLVLLALKSWLISNSNDSSALLGDYFNYLFPLTVFTFLFLILDAYNTTLFNAIRGIFLKEFLQRVLILLVIILYAVAIVNFSNFVNLYVLAIGIPPLILSYYLLKNKEFCLKPDFGPQLRDRGRLMFNIGLNGVIIGFSGMVILVIDRIMVERYMGLGSAGIYTTLAYFATLVSIPSRALLKISDPVIARSWKENDLQGLLDNYYRSALHQFLIGSLIMAGVWGNIDNIMRILPVEYGIGKYVVLFIGLAFLSDMLTGTATYILANSKYFKYQTYYILMLVVLIIVSNWLLIPVWGLSGAAIATLGSKLLSNLIRHQILYRKFGLQPYNGKFLLILCITGLAYFSQYFIPQLNNLSLDIGIRSALMSVVFISLAILLRISPEVNEKFFWMTGKIRNKFNGWRT